MENVVETLKTLYKKRTQLVNGTLKGGFIDHEAAENKAIDIAIEALEKQQPKRPLIIEMSRYTDNEPFDNLACGNCKTILIYEIEWEDLLLDEEKIKNIAKDYNINGNEFGYCPKCGQKIDWSNEP